MRKLMVLLAIAAMTVIAYTGVSWAPPCNCNGLGYYACEVPNPAAMVIDGSDADWGWFPADYKISRADDGWCSTVGKPMPPTSDWDAVAMLGWTAPGATGNAEYDNMYYLFSVVTDDTLAVPGDNPDSGWSDDQQVLSTNVSNSGGDCTDRNQGGQFRFHMITPTWDRDAVLAAKIPLEEQWSVRAPYCFVGIQSDPAGAGDMSTDVTMYYEIKMAAWDAYSRTGGVGASTRHTFVAGTDVATMITINEKDAVWENQISTGCNNKAGSLNMTEDMSTFTLLSVEDYGGTRVTALEPGSWGTIKALFR